MKDNEFEKLLQDSIKLYGHEYPELPTNDISEIHRFPDNFLDDILPHTKPKKPFILKHIRAISAAAAVMVIGLAAVIIASNTGPKNMDDMIDKTAAHNSSIENNKASSGDYISDTKQNSSPIKNNDHQNSGEIKEPEKIPVRDQSTSDDKKGETDNAGITDTETSKETPAENPVEESYTQPVEESYNPVYELSDEAPVEESGEYTTEESGEYTPEESEEYPIEASGYFSEASEDYYYEASETEYVTDPDDHVIDSLLFFLSQENADDPVNNNIISILSDAKKYVTDSYSVDASAVNSFEIKYTYVFRRSTSDGSINIDGTDFEGISILDLGMGNGLVITAECSNGPKYYLIPETEDDMSTLRSKLESLPR